MPLRDASISADASAEIGEPPAPTMPTAANCEAPVNTSRDITLAWRTESPTLVASTPKVTPNRPTAAPRTMPSRT